MNAAVPRLRLVLQLLPLLAAIATVARALPALPVAGAPSEACVGGLNALQEGFDGLLRASSQGAAAQQKAAAALAARFAADGTLADPAWVPVTSRANIAAHEMKQYAPLPNGCTQGLTWTVGRAVGGNGTVPAGSAGAGDTALYCAADLVFNVTVVGKGGACSALGNETDTFVVLPDGTFSHAATIYDTAQFVDRYTACASKVCV